MAGVPLRGPGQGSVDVGGGDEGMEVDGFGDSWSDEMDVDVD